MMTEEDLDAGYGSEAATTASTSIASSMWHYAYENGRRYHKFREGRYNFPNDDLEQQREDMKHVMVKMLTGERLHFAPLDPERSASLRVLDIGTGTGIWATEMGDAYPSASVLGVDLSPIQPDWVPPNVRFMVDDAESSWLYPRNHFDYIHSRHTVMAIRDWPRLVTRAYEHLRPGGWLELQEIHHFPHAQGTGRTLAEEQAQHPVGRYWGYIGEGLRALGVNMTLATELAGLLRRRGYVDVGERVFQVPIGPWPRGNNRTLRRVGLYWRTILLDGIQAIALGPLTRGLGWPREQVETFLAAVRKAYVDPDGPALYMPFICVYGRKPALGYRPE
ncbi:S-adenosyl-L-methionine-dependent methyltransferase [Xylariomycetidae sp. FL0641]|nr:S-adenosyl-L-methionine-dependent methyltransferase [Xylariomycetidae sp. FL0641]